MTGVSICAINFLELSFLEMMVRLRINANKNSSLAKLRILHAELGENL